MRVGSGRAQDAIFDNGAGSGEINTLQFGAAIAPAQVSVKESGSGDPVLSTTASKAKITLRGQLLSADSGVDQVGARRRHGADPRHAAGACTGARAF